jgi:hypothetical protein
MLFGAGDDQETDESDEDDYDEADYWREGDELRVEFGGSVLIHSDAEVKRQCFAGVLR